MTQVRPYVGRFAPSPTGRLHLGSMVAAVASYLDARAHNGTWLVRMEDLDPPREVPGAADDILRTLEGFGLHWDGEVLYQHSRHGAYREALESLKKRDQAFGCICTRKDLEAVGGTLVYPGTCRKGLPVGISPRSWRFRMPPGKSLSWMDRIQGVQEVNSEEVGDVILLRADGFWAYHLAVVVDDQFQSITDVVRGADLLSSTAVHVALKGALECSKLRYAHVPVVTNAKGQKLSKQTLAEPVDLKNANSVLSAVFKHLSLDDVEPDSPQLMLDQATRRWAETRMRRDSFYP